MSVQVQTAIAIIAALKADAPLTALLTTYAASPAVFTHVPQDFETYPYVVLFEAGMDSEDNDAYLGFDGIINIHSWSDARDMAVIGNIQKAIYDVLHLGNLTMTGYEVPEIHQEFSTILRDPDGITLHGVSPFKKRTSQSITSRSMFRAIQAMVGLLFWLSQATKVLKWVSAVSLKT